MPPTLHSRTRARPPFLLLAAVLLTGCQDGLGPLWDDAQESLLFVTANVTGTPVEGVTVEINAADIDGTLVQNIPIEVDASGGKTASGTIRVPAGSDRLVTVRAYNGEAIETHRGARELDIHPGKNVAVTIVLDPLMGDQPIEVVCATYTISVDPAEATLEVGATLEVSATVTDADGLEVTDPELVWGSTNPVVATVDRTGTVAGATAGEAHIAVSYKGVTALSAITVAEASGSDPAPPGRIAFSSSRSGTRLVHLMSADGSGVADVAEGSSPLWSPDGTRILLNRSRAFISVNPDGTDEVQLTSSGSRPAWSPDGSAIAFHDFRWLEAPPAIFISRADGSGEEYLADGKDPTWSPDGTRVAVEVPVTTGIKVVEADGTGETQLISDGTMPAWSPDGSQIAFVRNLDGNFEIYTINADGTGLTRLTDREGHDQAPVWSPDGTRIAFLGPGDIYVMNADGTDLRNLTQTPEEGERSVTWSPDGEYIAFHTCCLILDVYIIRADGTGRTNLTDDPEGAPDVSPDWGVDPTG